MGSVRSARAYFRSSRRTRTAPIATTTTPRRIKGAKFPDGATAVVLGPGTSSWWMAERAESGVIGVATVEVPVDVVAMDPVGSPPERGTRAEVFGPALDASGAVAGCSGTTAARPVEVAVAFAEGTTNSQSTTVAPPPGALNT
jgi:hypothetical protein